MSCQVNLREAFSMAVGEDGEDDFTRTLLFGQRLDALFETLDGAADGIDQGGHSPRLVGLGVEADNFADRDVVDRHLVAVVELNEGETGDAFGLLLVAQEFVETSDGSLGVRIHRAGAIEDVGDFGGWLGGFFGCGIVFRFHVGLTISPGVGHG